MSAMVLSDKNRTSGQKIDGGPRLQQDSCCIQSVYLNAGVISL